MARALRTRADSATDNHPPSANHAGEQTVRKRAERIDSAAQHDRTDNRVSQHLSMAIDNRVDRRLSQCDGCVSGGRVRPDILAGGVSVVARARLVAVRIWRRSRYPGQYRRGTNERPL